MISIERNANASVCGYSEDGGNHVEVYSVAIASDSIIATRSTPENLFSPPTSMTRRGSISRACAVSADTPWWTPPNTCLPKRPTLRCSANRSNEWHPTIRTAAFENQTGSVFIFDARHHAQSYFSDNDINVW